MAKRNIASRSEAAVAAVLPRTVRIRRISEDGRSVDLKINRQPVQVTWAGEGGLRQVRELIAHRQGRPNVVAARRMSPGARETLSAKGIGWVDETGAAEIVLDSLIVSKSGRPPVAEPKPPHWTPSVLAAAEALFCRELATVSTIQEATGLSTGAATNALRTLTDIGLLRSAASRGRDSARQIADSDRMLDEYATAATKMKPTAALTVGVVWRDFATGLSEAGRHWERSGMAWAATGAVAASVLAPYLTRVTAGEAYVGARTVAELESAAARAGLRPIEGGRLTLRPFPTVATEKLAKVDGGLRVAPWPRAYADLRVAGARGEEAAEHLRETSLEPNMVQLVDYKPSERSAEATFTICGKKYVQKVSLVKGRIVANRSHWIQNKSKTIKRALDLLLRKNDELVEDLYVYKAIKKMQHDLLRSTD